MRVRWVLLPCLLASAAAVAAAVPEPPAPPKPTDWPQWQGPHRDGYAADTGLLQTWPKEGPPLAWRAENLGGGYSAPAVACGLVIGMGNRGSDEVVWAIDEASGKEVWAHKIARAVHDPKEVGYPQGPRCTPAVDGPLVYVLGVLGDLVCLETATGKPVWSKNLVSDFGGKVPRWGYTESPLVDGKHVLATPGAATAIVALDKADGGVVWRAKVPGNDEANYASIIAATIQGRKQYVQFMRNGIVSVAADDGKFLWRYDRPANGNGINISTAVVSGDRVFGSSAYGRGFGCAAIKKEGEAFKVEQLYDGTALKNHHGGLLLHDNCIYGATGGNGEERLYALVCMDFDNGKVLWESKEAGKGSIAFADGRIYYRNEDGPMLLIEPSKAGYQERGRFEQPSRSKQKAWPHPVIANGKLYLRDQDLLLVYDVRKK